MEKCIRHRFRRISLVLAATAVFSATVSISAFAATGNKEARQAYRAEAAALRETNKALREEIKAVNEEIKTIRTEYQTILKNYRTENSLPEGVTKEALLEAKAMRKEMTAVQKAERVESTDPGAEMEEETDKAGETTAEATAGSLAKAGDYEGALNVIRGKIAGNEEKLATRKSVLETWKQIGALVGIQ